MIGELLLLVALVGCSAFFAASETSYLSLSRVTLRGLQKSKDAAEKRVRKLHQALDHLLSTVLVGTNLVNSLASSIAAGIALGWAGSHFSAQHEGRVLTLVTLVMTVIIVMFSDVLPKTIAAYRPLPVAKATSLPLTVLSAVFHPFVLLFSGLARGLNALVDNIARGSHAGGDALVTEEELNTLIEVGNREGTVTHGEKDLLKRIIKFQDMKAENIMRHRSLVQGVSKDATFDSLVAAFASRRYSQIPVFDGTPDNYVGLVDFRDLLHGKELFRMEDAITARKLRFVPGTMSAATLLQTFRREGVHFAVVVDERGGNQGVVTLKDVLHAVLGRIDRAPEQAGPAQVRILGS
jgi:putative hemolysin